MEVKICLKCKLEFIKPKNYSNVKWLIRKFCSKSCSNSFNSIGTKRCVGRIPHNKNVKNINIQGDKHPLWKGGKISKNCLECNKIFNISRYRENIAKFCSVICKINNSNKGKTEESKKIRMSLKYKIWRTEVFKRDLYTCQICGINSKKAGKSIVLNADHILPFSIFPEFRLDLNNGRTLCINCHKDTPTYGSKLRRKNLIALAQES